MLGHIEATKVPETLEDCQCLSCKACMYGPHLPKDESDCYEIRLCPVRKLLKQLNRTETE